MSISHFNKLKRVGTTWTTISNNIKKNKSQLWWIKSKDYRQKKRKKLEIKILIEKYILLSSHKTGNKILSQNNWCHNHVTGKCKNTSFNKRITKPIRKRKTDFKTHHSWTHMMITWEIKIQNLRRFESCRKLIIKNNYCAAKKKKSWITLISLTWTYTYLNKYSIYLFCSFYTTTRKCFHYHLHSAHTVNKITISLLYYFR